MNKNLTTLLDKYPGTRVAVAVSGGADSMALLHLVSAAGLDAVALTVDHGLRANSGHEAKIVERFAAQIGIPHTTLHWSERKPKTGIEEAARAARYKLLTDFCRTHDIGVLLTAHQADDQIETFLLNLGRGSGVYGLAAMRPETMRDGIVIARPLLSVPRAALAEYCKKNKIKFATDAMNDDETFARVHIRKNRHLLSERLGVTDARMRTAIDALGRVRDVLENDVDRMVGLVMPGAATRAVFSAAFLNDMPEEVRMKFLSRLFQKIGGADYPPRLEKIKRAITMLNNDCKFTTAHCIMRRLGDKILIAPEGTSCSFKSVTGNR